MVNLRGQGGRLTALGRELAALGEWELYSDPYGVRVGAKVLRYNSYLLPRTKIAEVTLDLGPKTIKHSELAVWWDGERLILDKGAPRG